jgi:hypothetical protein
MTCDCAGCAGCAGCCANTADWPNDKMPTLHKIATTWENDLFKDFEMTCFAFIAFVVITESIGAAAITLL